MKYSRRDDIKDQIMEELERKLGTFSATAIVVANMIRHRNFYPVRSSGCQSAQSGMGASLLAVRRFDRYCRGPLLC